MACCERPGAPARTALAVLLLTASAATLPREGIARAADGAGELEPADAVLRARASLANEAGRARRWRYAWTAINAGLAIVSFAAMPWSDRDDWPELAVGGAGSAISTALTVAWPLDVEEAPRGLATAGTDMARVDALRGAYGRDERNRLAWPWHLLNVGVGVAYLGILGLGWGHWQKGAWAGLTAFGIGEIQTLTQPSALATW